MTRSTYTLSQVVNLIGGGTPKRSETAFWNGDIPWLSIKDFNNDSRYVVNAEESITRLGLEKSSTKILDPGMLVISARGTVGELAQLKSQMAFNQSCYGIDANSEYLENDYLYYLLKIKIRELKSIAHGSVFDTITRETFDSIFISIPPKKEQLAIVEILGALDRKIEINRKMNETLEEIAKTLFKSWFIDFDPVRAKAEGRPTGLSKEISDLFPNSFEGSKLGEIPKGWKKKSFGNLVTPKRGKVITKSTITKGSIPVVAGGIKPPYYHSESNAEPPIVTISASGTAGFVNLYYQDIWASDCSYINKEITDYVFFIYSFLKINQQRIYDLRHGAVQQHVYPKDLIELPIFLPSISLIKEYERIVTPLHEKISLNLQESKNLEAIRDNLLPKLISGELKIPDAESFVEEAGT